ncbi:MAG TPA: DUF1365 domain-containing protein [Gemmataceae bacterium]|nr:DUF1365 domain-containing protein [Gemmataceae bacterium]
MESCLYEGVLHHERLTPVRHRFHYRLCLAYLALEELPGLAKLNLISTDRFGLASFRRTDHVGDPRQNMADCIRDIVERESDARPTGSIRVLTQLSCLGYYFSPLNLFYCSEPDGESLEAVVAEVQNTPWLERHAYVLCDGNRETSRGDGVYRHAKNFHVSPFMGMNVEYRWHIQQPDERLDVRIENLVDEAPVFRAGLHLRRVPWTRANRNRLLLRYPLAPFRITAAIYWQAFQLWRKKCPFYSHPKHVKPGPAVSPVGSVVTRPSCNEHVATASCDV